MGSGLDIVYTKSCRLWLFDPVVQEGPWVIGPSRVIGLIYLLGQPPTGITYRTMYYLLVIGPCVQLVIGLCLLDEQGELSDQPTFFYLFLATEPIEWYNTVDMTTNTNKRGNEMTTKIIAIAIAIGIGLVVASNLIGMFGRITATLSTIVSY